MKLIIFHDPKKDYIIKGNKRILHSVPIHKSLFGVSDNKGLPIGNYTSQFFANVYLNELDQYAKHTLKCKYYFRYMDDMVILDQDKNRLHEIIKLLNTFLNEKLKIELHPKKTILQQAKKGINFLGYIIYPEYTLSRKRVVENIRAKLNYFNKILVNTSNIEEIEKVVKKAQAVINSYWGHFKYADSICLKDKLYRKHFKELKKYLIKSENGAHFIIKKGIFPIE